MRRTGFKLAIAAILLIGLAAGQAQANLLVNGDFETCDLTGWDLAGNTSFSGVGPYNPHNGTCAAYFGAVGSDSIFMQSATITTIPGRKYVLSFWLSNEDYTGGPNDFSVAWNGDPPLLSLVNAGPFGYTEHKFLVTGTGSDNITFRFRNDPSYYLLDDVSLDGPRAVPVLPFWSLGLLAGLLAGVVGFGRRLLRQ